jgi:CRISPR-associated protein Cas5t
MLYLYLQAPYAACRSFTAGWYRPTATFITPSAAYGLVLNIAGIESRLREEDEEHDGRAPTSLMRSNLPPVRLAIGVPAVHDGMDSFPRVQTIYQQLHNYPVGASGKERADDAKGSKYNITPVRREFLSNLRAIIAITENADLEDRIRRGLHGEFNVDRYGLPFIGDNSFLLDRLEECDSSPSTYWYERIGEDNGDGPRPHTTRLTILIDRAELSKTTSALFAPTDSATSSIPDAAWILIDPQPVTEAAKPQRRRS